MRIEGPAANARLRSFTIADMNNDGKNDLIIGAQIADFNGRTDSGSIYIIYSSILDDAIRRNGQQFSLADNRNWNIRIDGASANNTVGQSFVVGDLDNDDKNDLAIGSPGSSNNSRTASGSLYIPYNTLIDDYSGTGNTIDLNTTTNYNLRYDGAVTLNSLGQININISDLDNDGKNDLIAGASVADFNSRTNSGSVYVIYNTLIDDYSSTGNNIDLNTATNYNIRFDGEAANDQLGGSRAAIGDFDHDNKNDLVIGGQVADPNSKADAGSVYLFFNTLLDDSVGTGNAVNLTTSSTYSVRWEGTAADDRLQVAGSGDVDNDQRDDLLLATKFSDFNSRTNSGALFIIPNTITDDYATTTGNQINLATTTTYRLRIDGAAAADQFGTPIYIQDFNEDGRNDLAVSAVQTSFHGRTGSGSMYVIDNTLVNQYTGTGNIIDVNNRPSFTARFDAANAGDTMTQDLAFKKYDRGDINNDGLQDIFLDAQDGGPRSAGMGAGYLYIIYGRPNSTSAVVGIKQTVPDLRANEGGTVGRDNMVMVVEGETFPWDSYLYKERTEKSALSPVVFSAGNYLFSQISPVYYMVWRAFFNDAKILTADKPFIVAFNYHPEDIGIFTEKQFKLAYSADKQSWKILPNSIVDTTNRSVATTTKATEGYYAIVAGIPTEISSASNNPILGETTTTPPTPSIKPEITPQPSVSPPQFETLREYSGQAEKTQWCLLWWCW